MEGGRRRGGARCSEFACGRECFTGEDGNRQGEEHLVRHVYGGVLVRGK